MLQRLSIFLPSFIAITVCGQSLQAAVAFLTFSPGSITVSGNAGGAVVTQTVLLENTGNTATNWSLSSSAPWLTASPASGTGLAAGSSITLTVSANPANLNPSSGAGYQASITPQGSGGGVPLPVTFSVVGAAFTVIPNPISLSVLQGTRETFANVAQINGNAKVLITVTSGAWLTADSGASAPAPFSLIADATGLSASLTPYQGSLLIQCINAPCVSQTVAVNLTVFSQLTMSCSPATGPAQVGVAYSSTCTASGGDGSYLWSLGAGSMPGGLSLSATTGGTIQVSGTPTTPGPYSFTVRASDRSAQQPQSASQTFSGTIAPAAALSAAPSVLSFGSYTVGGTTPAAQSISVGSANPASGLGFTAMLGPDCSWLNLSAVAGSTPATLTAAVNSANALIGNHSCLITFSSPGVSTSPMVTATLVIGAGKPVISAIVNSAGFSPGGPLAPGSWATVFGSNLAPPGDSRQWNSATEIVNGNFPTSLDGINVSVNEKPASVEFISPAQVNIQLPDDTAVGPVQVVIQTAAGSASITANYAPFAPGFFLATTSYLAAQHSDGSYVGGYPGATPAKPGEVITLWGTGFGPAMPPVPAGQVFTGAGTLVNNVTLTIGGQPAIVDFAGYVGAGLVQINVEVPLSIDNGDAAVVAAAGGVSTQATSNLIAVHN